MKQGASCFDILILRQTLFHLYQKLFIELSTKYHLNQMELDILLFLANNPQYDTAKDIVTIRHLTKSHVSSSVESLVQKNLLTRKRETENKKIIHLLLTEKTTEIIQKGRNCQEKFKNILIAGIDPNELSIAQNVLKQILENIDSYGDGL